LGDDVVDCVVAIGYAVDAVVAFDVYVVDCVVVVVSFLCWCYGFCRLRLCCYY